jgi:hypothetical protein
MVVVVTMMMMVFCKSGSRKEHDHGEQQSLFHVPNDSNNSIGSFAAPVLLLGHAGSTMRLFRVRKKNTRVISR